MDENKGYNFIAGWTLSNHGGVGVIDMESDFMTVKYYDDEPETCEIKYEFDDEIGDIRAYIMIGEIKLYLDECMRYN